MLTVKKDEGCMFNIPLQLKCYTILKQIGKGHFAFVFKVKQCISNKIFAAKVIPMKFLESENAKQSIDNEVCILRSIKHKNIIKLYDIFEVENNKEEKMKVFIEEYCSQGCMFDYIINERFKDENEKKKMIIDFIEAISYLHEKRIAHCDIKVDNILIDNNNNIKICDFGLSKNFNKKHNEIHCGSLAYASPEIRTKGNVDFFKSDIWSVGITLYAIETKQLPYKNKHDVLNCTLNIEMENEELKRVIKKCLQINPDMRPNAKELLNDEFFSISSEDGEISQKIDAIDVNNSPNEVAK